MSTVSCIICGAPAFVPTARLFTSTDAICRACRRAINARPVAVQQGMWETDQQGARHSIDLIAAD